jgi:Domain of unknown function (DUF4124)
MKIRSASWLWITAILSLAPASVSAESFYKWQDENGKWHFSDKPPTGTATEAAEIGPVNTSDNSNEALRNVFPKETAAERHHRQQKAEQQGQMEAQRKLDCRKARQYLSKIEGRVVFLDDEGQPIHTTEDQREAKAQALRQKIARYCP